MKGKGIFWAILILSGIGCLIQSVTLSTNNDDGTPDIYLPAALVVFGILFFVAVIELTRIKNYNSNIKISND